VRDGETLVTDGPFADTKEALGGYFLIEVESFDEAAGWAAKVPTARYGVVEVRSVVMQEAEVNAWRRSSACRGGGEHASHASCLPIRRSPSRGPFAGAGWFAAKFTI
jgi:YCII-related domain